jgi:hypothetical protein
MAIANGNSFIFGLEVSVIAAAIVLLTMTVVAAEYRATEGRTLATIEVANESPLGSIATAIHLPK